jgi:hypothetical protein
MRGRRDEARHNLQWLRGDSYDVSGELDAMAEAMVRARTSTVRRPVKPRSKVEEESNNKAYDGHLENGKEPDEPVENGKESVDHVENGKESVDHVEHGKELADPLPDVKVVSGGGTGMMAEFRKPHVYKPCLLLMLLMTLMMWSGGNVMVFYAVDIFRASAISYRLCEVSVYLK